MMVTSLGKDVDSLKSFNQGYIFCFIISPTPPNVFSVHQNPQSAPLRNIVIFSHATEIVNFSFKKITDIVLNEIKQD